MGGTTKGKETQLTCDADATKYTRTSPSLLSCTLVERAAIPLTKILYAGGLDKDEPTNEGRRSLQPAHKTKVQAADLRSHEGSGSGHRQSAL